ncbi:PP2C family protein-serine/threonine phosphatase [Actinacidiphila rubida]|uniref:PP2C family protein-serine/threonine phosphatase n=1 Tax=Actinacidiphila rubida TaxID=310780 RepID=UPI0009A0E2D8|nr:GAF domain-containing SpoIIE family protein phosphatase [Actinacidiphila rubida]
MHRRGEESPRQADDRDGVPAPFAVVEEAVESIGTTLNERTTCAELARFLCREICEAAAVDLLTEDVPTSRPAAGTAPLVRAAAAGRASLLEPWTPPFAEDRPLSVRALDEGHPITASVDLSGGEHRSATSVPLIAHGRLYGAVLAVRAGKPFDAPETATLHYATRLAAVHIGHDRRHTAVQSTALNLQRALLAEPGRPHPNLDVATRYLPSGGGALVGGDWFETVRLHFGRTLLVMGDVMGHGLDAAVDMNAYRSMLRYVASTDLPPHRVLRQLDVAVAEDGSRRPATCLLVRVDPARDTVALVSAGHLPPVVFGADGTGTLVDVPVGPPLGTGIGGYEQLTRALDPDETLLMYTDGLVERRHEDIDVSLARLAGLALPPGATIQQVLDEVLHRLDAYRAEDDVAVLAARIHRRRPAGTS